MSKHTSIVVISHNRPNYVDKFCKLLNIQKFHGTLIICDSSVQKNFLKTSKLIENKKKFNFKIKHYQITKKKGDKVSYSMNDSYAKGLKNIRTKYFIMTCDDDIPSVKAINLFEKFLSNSNYEACIGDLAWHSKEKISKNIFFRLIKKIPFFRVGAFFMQRFGIVKGYSLVEKFPMDRIEKYFSVDKRFHPLFTFQRKNVAKYIINKKHRKISFNHLSADYHWMFSIILSSRIYYIPVTHIHRFFHGKNLSIKNKKHPHPSIFQGIISSNWSSDLNNFFNSLKNISCQYSGRKLNEKNRDQFLNYYLLGMLKGNRNLNKKITSTFQRRLEKVKLYLYNLKYIFNFNKDYSEYSFFQESFYKKN